MGVVKWKGEEEECQMSGGAEEKLLFGSGGK